MAAPLLVVLAVASAASIAVADVGYGPCGYEPVDVHLVSDLCTRPHGEMFGALHATMTDSMPLLEIKRHRFLSPKDAEPSDFLPACWVKLHLAGCGDDDRVTLGLSDGDAETRAFADSSGRWHAYPGYEPLFPGATTLPFNGSYRELIGNASALQAVHTLSHYDPRATPEPDVKAALTRLKVMTTEALRWKPIRETFSGGKLGERETFIAEEQARFVDHWSELSLLLRWEATGRWEGDQAKEAEKIGIHGAEKALGLADLLKRPRELCIAG